MRYEDTTVRVDDDGITIQRYGMFGSTKVIDFVDVATVSTSHLGAIGRWRLAGAGPGSGLRNWYGWDNTRRSKNTAFSFDVNSFWRPTVTPDDPESFLSALPPTLDIL